MFDRRPNVASGCQQNGRMAVRSSTWVGARSGSALAWSLRTCTAAQITDTPGPCCRSACSSATATAPDCRSSRSTATMSWWTTAVRSSRPQLGAGAGCAVAHCLPPPEPYACSNEPSSYTRPSAGSTRLRAAAAAATQPSQPSSVLAAGKAHGKTGRGASHRSGAAAAAAATSASCLSRAALSVFDSFFGFLSFPISHRGKHTRRGGEQHWSPAGLTGRQSLVVTGHWSPVTGHRSLVTRR